MKKGQKIRGFTLMEMIISLSIFMLFIGIITTSYISVVSANKKAAEIQNLYREIRFVFDTFAQEIRSGIMDYSCIEETQLDAFCVENQGSGKKTVLGILHSNSLQRSLYKFSDGKIMLMKQSRTALSNPWGIKSGWQALTSENLPLDDLSFSFFPLKNPYASSSASSDEIQFQPSVTINMQTKDYVMHTTYSSRTYGKQTLYENS